MKEMRKTSLFGTRRVKYQEIKKALDAVQKATKINMDTDELQGGDGWLFGETAGSTNVYLEEYE